MEWVLKKKLTSVVFVQVGSWWLTFLVNVNCTRLSYLHVKTMLLSLITWNLTNSTCTLFTSCFLGKAEINHKWLDPISYLNDTYKHSSAFCFYYCIAEKVVVFIRNSTMKVHHQLKSVDYFSRKAVLYYPGEFLTSLKIGKVIPYFNIGKHKTWTKRSRFMIFRSRKLRHWTFPGGLLAVRTVCNNDSLP